MERLIVAKQANCGGSSISRLTLARKRVSREVPGSESTTAVGSAECVGEFGKKQGNSSKAKVLIIWDTPTPGLCWRAGPATAYNKLALQVVNERTNR